MSLEPQPGHSSRTVAVAVLLLAVFLMVTFYKGRKSSVRGRSRKQCACNTNLVAVSTVVVDVGRDRDDLVAVLVGLPAGTEADLEPSTLWNELG